MGGRGGGSSSSALGQAQAKAKAAASSPEAQVRQAYGGLPKGPAGYVGLADLRDRLSGLSRESVDRTLREMSRLPGVSVAPVANRKSLTDRDRAAMLRIGEDENFMISIDEVRR